MKNHHLPRKPSAGRSARGAGIVVLVFLLAFFVIGVIGVFAFEVTRNNSCRDELRSSCEAAALAAAAALASSNFTSASASHDNAEKAAMQAFVSNSIVGTLLSDVNWYDSRGPVGGAQSTNGATGKPDPNAPPVAGNPSNSTGQGNATGQGNGASGTGGGGLSPQQILASQPPAGWVNFYIEFLTPQGGQSQWNQSDGRIVHVVAVFGEEPSFAKYAGLTAVAVTSQARAQVPQMDIMMCFDVSGSIDDQSRVTFVKRWLNGGTISYTIATTLAGTPAEGTIYGILQPAPTGTSVGVERPQALSSSGSQLTFNPGLRSGGADSGQPPGGGSGGPNDFTDLVANLDGNNHFISFTYTDPGSGQVYAFPSLGAVVEAARGNLENAAVFASSMAGASLTGVTPQAGYQNAYFNLCHQAAQPIGAARLAAQRFFVLMNNNTDAQFGYISFSNRMPSLNPAGTLPTTQNISSNYPAGGNVTPAYPGEPLGLNTAATIGNTLIPLTVADGSTDIGDALQMAVDQLVAGGRPGSNKAIVFFTDGQPTVGPSWNAAATEANTKGIAIYTVGMAQNSAIIPAECNNLNDQAGKAITYTDPITGSTSTYAPATPGMAAVAGHGSKFFLVTNYNDLNFVFENIARQLVQLTVR
jgi:hypothetical protein